MTCRTPNRPRTPAMIRANHDSGPSTPQPVADVTGRPALSAGPDTDGFSEWMAHVDAGRIALR